SLRPPPRPHLLPYTPLFRSLPDAWQVEQEQRPAQADRLERGPRRLDRGVAREDSDELRGSDLGQEPRVGQVARQRDVRRQLGRQDRKSTRLNSSHVKISYAV